jgi:hypothetical protein
MQDDHSQIDGNIPLDRAGAAAARIKERAEKKKKAAQLHRKTGRLFKAGLVGVFRVVLGLIMHVFVPCVVLHAFWVLSGVLFGSLRIAAGSGSFDGPTGAGGTTSACDRMALHSEQLSYIRRLLYAPGLSIERVLLAANAVLLFVLVFIKGLLPCYTTGKVAAPVVAVLSVVMYMYMSPAFDCLWWNMVVAKVYYNIVVDTACDACCMMLYRDILSRSSKATWVKDQAQDFILRGRGIAGAMRLIEAHTPRWVNAVMPLKGDRGCVLVLLYYTGPHVISEVMSGLAATKEE